MREVGLERTNLQRLPKSDAGRETDNWRLARTAEGRGSVDERVGPVLRCPWILSYHECSNAAGCQHAMP